jgi:hypothetical protein
MSKGKLYFIVRDFSIDEGFQKVDDSWKAMCLL